MTPSLPEDQQRLLDGLLTRLEGLSDQAALVRFVAEVLRGLLRRRGDAAFREAIETAFVDGVAQHGWSAQKALAAEVLRVVITKRPEIARAWEAAQAGTAAPATPARRATDQPATTVPEAPVVTEEDPFAAAEAALGRYLVSLIRPRLDEFTTPPARMPAPAYRPGPPFFLFDPSFPDLLCGFIAGPLLHACRDGLERRVYRPSTQQTLLNAADWAGFMADKRDSVLAFVLDRLRRLAEVQRRAELRQVAAEPGAPAEPGYRVIEKKVTRPRVFSVLGVPFTLGQVTVLQRVRVRLPAANAPDPDEQTALALLEALRREAEQIGIDLPAAADLSVMHALLGGDRRAFALARDSLVALMGHASTTGPFLVERLWAAESSFDPALADLLGIMLFTRFGHGRFGLAELQAYCQRDGGDGNPIASSRPFCAQELASRPRALVVQFREAMRRRAHSDTVVGAVDLLLTCWKVLGRQEMTTELGDGLALFDGFASLFADDPDRPILDELTAMVRGELVAPTLGRASLLLAVGRLYDPVARRAAGRP